MTRNRQPMTLVRATVAGFIATVSKVIRSPGFFYVIVAVLVIQAVWIAVTARYPQAFDENFHFGIIQLHASQLLPFFTAQPQDAAVYGALIRDPSYLYHYLLSFPYRLLVHLTSSVTTQIIVLRLINIGIFVAGLYVYRRLFNELKITVAIRNITLLFFVLLPVVPLLAGQINYDNLMFYLTGLLFLYCVRLVHVLQTKQSIPVVLLMQIVTIGAFGSVVKFPFAPIFAGAVIILGWLIIGSIRQAKNKHQPVQHNVFVEPPNDWLGRLKLAAFTLLAIIAVLLCVERYGLNLVRYHSPVPACDKVLSIDECQSYSPWARDYLFANTYPDPTFKGIIVYPVVWFHRTVWETMFTITSYIYEPTGTVTYDARSPLTIANYTAWVIVIAGLLLLAVYWRRLWHNLPLRVLLLISLGYCFVLFVQNFAMYRHTGEAVAIHGRYLIPIYPIFLVAVCLSYSRFLDNFSNTGFMRRYTDARQLKTILVVMTLLFFMQGGGITAWIVNSDTAWYWQQSQPAARANWLAKDVLAKLIVTK